MACRGVGLYLANRSTQFHGRRRGGGDECRKKEEDARGDELHCVYVVL